MQKIFLVTSGSYSDYNVDAIFSTRELAEEWIKYQKDDDFTIEENELDPTIDKESYDNIPTFSVTIFKNGDILSLFRMSQFTKKEFKTVINGPRYFGSPNTLTLDIITRARDEEHARKIAGEIRQDYLRTNKFK